MGQSISLQLNRTLSIAPALQRSLQLLQMNALEFEQEISQALDSNPLLEMEESSDTADPVEAGDTASDAEEMQAAAEDVDYLDGTVSDSYDDISRDDLVTFDDIDAGAPADSAAVMDSDNGVEISAEHSEAAGDEFNEHLSDWSTTSKSGTGEGLSALDMAPAHGSLRDHLLQQLGSLRLSEGEQHLCMLIIDSLDPAGYLREDLEELAELSARFVEGNSRGKPAVGVDDVQIALRRASIPPALLPGPSRNA